MAGWPAKLLPRAVEDSTGKVLLASEGQGGALALDVALDSHAPEQGDPRLDAFIEQALRRIL